MKRIVCYGDSNTWGFIPKDGKRYSEDVRWPARLRNELGNGFIIEEEGLNGRTTVFDDPLQKNRNGLGYLDICLLTNRPIDLFILMLGTNDLKKHICNNVYASAKGIEVLVKKIKSFGMEQSEKIHILVLSPIEIQKDALDEVQSKFREAEGSKLFAKEFGAIAEENGCYFMDAAEYVAASKEDGVHLDAEGHSLLAKAVANKVREIFGNRGDHYITG